MPANRGIAIGVLCNQALLSEYDVRQPDERTVACFIASEPGKSFEITLTNNFGQQDMSVSVHIDGGYIGRYFLSPGQKILPGITVSESTTKPFRFRELNVKDERQLHDPRYYSWENVGTLDFNVYRCQKTGLERNPTPGPEVVATGAEAPIKSTQQVGGISMDPPDQPYTRIFFRYRPRDILVLQGIMQPTVSPLLQPSLSRSSPSTAVTAGSVSGKKRSLDLGSSMFDPGPPRPTQKLRITPSESPDTRPFEVPRPGSHTPSSSWEGPAGELRLMKGQLRAATEQMDAAMRQMRGAFDQMGRCMGQVQFLQRRIDDMETRTQGGQAMPPGDDQSSRGQADTHGFTMSWMPDQFTAQQQPRVPSWPPAPQG